MEKEIDSKKIGEMVMNRLKQLDDVAYVRFASVYRQFKDLNTFIEELNKLIKRKIGGTLMITKIKKRDGRIVDFSKEKIAAAIFKAASSVGGEDYETAENLTERVVSYIYKNNKSEIPDVEDIQDAVEKVLIETGHARTAKAYILYRSKRTRMRETKSELMDVVKDILVETSRENANVGNSPSAKMLQIASAASKYYYLNNIIPEEMSRGSY